MKRIVLSCALLFFSQNFLCSFDQSVFYYARFFPGEPRIEKEDLTTFDVLFAGGSTCTRTDSCGIPVCTERFERYRTHILELTATHNLTKHLFACLSVPFYRLCVLEEPRREREIKLIDGVTFTGGWTINYQDCEEFDFIDFTFETGIIYPSPGPSSSKGMPFSFTGAIGMYDWISFGLQADVVSFFDRASGGTLWDMCWYLKADHFLQGFSLLLGFSHSSRKRGSAPWSTEEIPFWTMNTLHFSFSYDAASYEYPALPTIEFFYNHVIDGKNIIKNSLFGFDLSTTF